MVVFANLAVGLQHDALNSAGGNRRLLHERRRNSPPAYQVGTGACSRLIIWDEDRLLLELHNDSVVLEGKRIRGVLSEPFG